MTSIVTKGASADGSVLVSHSNDSYDSDPGIFYASELGRVALERCRTAREAIHLMGKMIDEYGLWGTGETLLVADKDEGWVLEMQPTPSGKGGFISLRHPSRQAPDRAGYHESSSGLLRRNKV